MAALPVDSLYLDHSQTTSTSSEAPSAADPHSVQQFDQALQNKDDGSAEQGQTSEQTQETEQTAEKKVSPQDNPSASALLGSIFSKAMETSAPTQAAAPASPAELNSLATSLVNKILVSQPSDAQAAVHLDLTDGFLRDTHIQLQRDATGMLFVQVQSTDPASLNAITAALPTLRSQLEVYGPVNISTAAEHNFRQGQEKAPQGFTEQQHDSNRRSQGYMAYASDDKS